MLNPGIGTVDSNQKRDRVYWLRWTVFCGLGEWIGIAVAAAIAYFSQHWLGEPFSFIDGILVLVLMLFAGAVEGTILGAFQWHILRDRFPNIPKAEWLINTVIVAVLGWFLGTMPSLFWKPSPTPMMDNTSEVMSWVAPIIVLSAGLLLGALFGLFQWFVLRRYVEGASSWIHANALGWALGLAWIFTFASLPSETSSLLSIIICGISGGLLAGLSVGICTGFFLIKMKMKEHRNNGQTGSN